MYFADPSSGFTNNDLDPFVPVNGGCTAGLPGRDGRDGRDGSAGLPGRGNFVILNHAKAFYE